MAGWIVAAVLVAFTVYAGTTANRDRRARLAAAVEALQEAGFEVSVRRAASYMREVAETGIPAPWAFGGPKPEFTTPIVEVTARGATHVCTTTYWRLNDEGEAAAYLAGIEAGIELAK